MNEAQEYSLVDTIDRLRAMTEPSRAMDVTLRDILHPNISFIPWNPNPADWVTRIGDEWIPVFRAGASGNTSDRYVMRYTESIDAAVSLVPQDWQWVINRKGSPTATIGFGIGVETYWFADHPIPAIAVCIAILLSRQALSEAEKGEG